MLMLSCRPVPGGEGYLPVYGSGIWVPVYRYCPADLTYAPVHLSIVQCIRGCMGFAGLYVAGGIVCGRWVMSLSVSCSDLYAGITFWPDSAFLPPAGNIRCRPKYTGRVSSPVRTKLPATAPRSPVPAMSYVTGSGHMLVQTHSMASRDPGLYTVAHF
jgi:hypothetical protein